MTASPSHLLQEQARRHAAHRHQVELVRACLLCCPAARKATVPAQAGGRRA